MTTEDGIDVDKLTSDAFDAIDTLFSDDDDNNDESFFDGNDLTQEEDQNSVSDIDRVREFMLAMEWEYSESEISEFEAFLNEIIPQYSDRYNQDTLKMMSSVVRYIIKAKSNTVPETFYVLDKLAKTFSCINQPDLNESTIQHQVRSVYQKVLALKNKISGKRGSTYHLDGDGVKSSSSETDSGVMSTPPALAADTLQRDEMLSELIKRLIRCEKKLATLETQVENQNVHFEEKNEMLSLLNGLEERMDALERTSSSLNLSATPSLIEPSERPEDDGGEGSDAEFDLGGELSTAFEIAENKDLELDAKGADTPMLSDEGTLGEVNPDEVSFDDLDLSEDAFSEEIDIDTPSDDAAFDEVSPDDVAFDMLFDDDIDDTDTQQPLEGDEAGALDPSSEYDGGDISDELLISPPFDGLDVQDINDADDEDTYTLHADDIEYDELTLDDIFYDESAHETPDAADAIEENLESDDGQPMTPDHQGAIAGGGDEDTPFMEIDRDFPDSEKK